MAITMNEFLTVKNLRDLLVGRPDDQIVMVQIDYDDFTFGCHEVVETSEVAIAGSNQLYLHISLENKNDTE